MRSDGGSGEGREVVEHCVVMPSFVFWGEGGALGPWGLQVSDNGDCIVWDVETGQQTSLLESSHNDVTFPFPPFPYRLSVPASKHGSLRF